METLELYINIKSIENNPIGMVWILTVRGVLTLMADNKVTIFFNGTEPPQEFRKIELK